MEESHQGNELSNPTEWEKWTLNDNDDDDDDDVDTTSFGKNINVLQNVHLKHQFAIGFVQVAPLPAPPYSLHSSRRCISTSLFI